MPQPNSQPLYDIDEIVYVKASAAGRGFLEHVRIDQVHFDRNTGQWVYQINMNRAPDPGFGVGDNISLTKERILYFAESELIDYCSALALAKNWHTVQLGIINEQLDGNDCGTG
jgi:hypothetical protein